MNKNLRILLFIILIFAIGGLGLGAFYRFFQIKEEPIREAGAAAQCLTIRRGIYGTVEDNKIHKTTPDTNYGAADHMNVGEAGSWRSLIRFELEEIPAGSIVTSATLKLYCSTAYTQYDNNLHRVTAPWQESTVTWNNFNNAFSGAIEASFNCSSNNFVETDLTSLVQEWVSGNYAKYGFLLDAPGLPKNFGMSFASSEDSSVGHRPELEVCYQTPTPCPSCPLNPNLNRDPRDDGQLDVLLSWNDVTNEERYQIYRCEGWGCSNLFLIGTVVSEVTTAYTYTDNNGGLGFAPGTRLRYDIRPCRSGCTPECRDCEDEYITLPTCDCFGGWQNKGCGGSDCPDEKMYQEQPCYWSDDPTLCYTNTRCEPDPSCTGPWFQTREGDVHAEGNLIVSNMPTGQYFSVEGSAGSPGVISHNGSTPDFGNGSVSAPPAEWLAKVNLSKHPYAYFYNLLDPPSADNFDDFNNINNNGIYYSEDDVIINLNFPPGKKAVVLVNGKVNIKRDINIPIPSGGFLAIIASGDINIDKSVTQIEGIFITDSNLDTCPENPPCTDPLIGEGSFIAGSLNLGRDLGDNTAPAEEFIYRPDLTFNDFLDIRFTNYIWQER